MRKTHILVIFISFFTVLGSGNAHAVSKNTEEARIIKVGLVDNYLPCSDLSKSGIKSGFALDIWREVQEDLVDITYKKIGIKSFDKAVEYAAEGKADLIVSCHTITKERLEKVDFSVPYVSNSVGIISAVKDRSHLSRLISVLGKEHVLRSLILLLGITGIVAVTTTLLERPKNDIKKREQIQTTFKNWTLLFIGQALESLAEKRFIYVPLVLIAGCTQILLVSILVAELTTSSLDQATRLEALEDINKRELREIIFEGLAVVDNTENKRRLENKMKADGLTNKSLISKLFLPETLPQMIDGLKLGKYRHIMASSAVLKYVLAHDLNPLKYEISILSEYTTPEAFIFGKNLSKEDRRTINQGIAEMDYDGRVMNILKRYE